MGRVRTDPVPRFLASSGRVGAMSQFGRPVGFQWIFIGVLLIVGFLGLRWASLSEAQAQEKDKNREELKKEELQKLLYLKAVQEAERALKGVGDLVAPLAQKHFLEKGKSYSFSWQDSIGPAVVLEEPRENWVKVRVKDRDRGGEEIDQWINLNTVHRVVPTPQAREKKDAEKGAVETKGTVKGIVTLNGKPVEKGKVTFRPEKGDPIQAEIKDGRYTAEGVPVGTARVILKGLPGQDINVDTNLNTVLEVRVKEGENVFDFALKN
jgi:hypothetical protein